MTSTRLKGVEVKNATMFIFVKNIKYYISLYCLESNCAVYSDS